MKIACAVLVIFAVPLFAAPGNATPQWSSTAVLWQSGTYVYDGAGNIMEIDNDRYRYDAFGRLNYATAKTPGNPANLQTFTYDRFGNVLTTDAATANGVTREAYAVDANTNQLDHAACAGTYAICYRAVYDNAGRQVGRYNSGEYQWDALGFLKEVDSMRHEQYLYDANDERVVVIHYAGAIETSRRYTLRFTDNTVTRELTFHPASSTWSVTKDYVYRPGGLMASFSGTGSAPDRHYHLDHLGSTRLITDGAAHKVAMHTYWPFGREADGSELDHERLKFAGHERDSSGGTPGFDLDYMHARFHDPNQKRFLSIDPVMNVKASAAAPQLWNRYTYANNNPVNRVDRDGKWASWFYTVHQDAIDSALPFVEEDLREILKAEQERVDRDQARQYKHAMSLPGQSVEEARKLAQEFIDKSMEKAVAHQLEGNTEMAMVHLGAAMHTLQDSTSPSHEGYQVFDPSWSTTSRQVRDHVRQELHDDTQSFGRSGRSLNEVTYAAWAYFAHRTGQQLPITPLSNTVKDPSSHALIEVP